MDIEGIIRGNKSIPCLYSDTCSSSSSSSVLYNLFVQIYEGTFKSTHFDYYQGS